MSELALNNNIEIAGVYFGLAGGVNGKNAEIVYNYFKNKYFQNIPFSNAGDDLNAINAGVKNSPNGIAVIAGTGSNVMLKKDGVVLPNPQLSGWGYMFDKGASGFDFGRDAIVASKKDINGTGKKTLITKMLEEKFKAPVFDSLKEVYSKGVDFVASLAPIVFDAYREGDEVAKAIIEDEFACVADMINKGHEIIGKDVDAKVGLMGGIFSHEVEIVRPLMKKMIDSNLTITIPQESQIYGALMEAAKNAGVQADAKFLSHYQDTIKNPVLQSEAKGYERQ
jgi:N-acetylglucosamine kinase-like BadF-type ATPase